MPADQPDIEQWGLFELSLPGPSNGNPFNEVAFQVRFEGPGRNFVADGFYDGDETYVLRCMPDTQGGWHFTTISNVPALDGVTGDFTCVAPGAGNHGPVRVNNTFHFAYADGTPHYSIGTTCYAWTHQGDALEEQTLATLAAAPFNKLRMCVFPKDYTYNRNEPPLHPFERSQSGENDYTRFNPTFFRHFERRVLDLQALGIEADVILFHPYDRWGYATMSEADDLRYLRYVVARLSAFRNVWWSFANEFDLMDKPMERWDTFFQTVQEYDPYAHLRSIHNGKVLYDHSKPWVTHVSIQSWDVHSTGIWRKTYQKPVVNDELQYEGNIPHNWGSISAQSLVDRMWATFAYGAYAGHGETYVHPEDILWWSKGGVLHGESAPRLAFLRRILEEFPPGGLTYIENAAGWRDEIPASLNGDHRLIYFGVHQPVAWTRDLPVSGKYQVEVIDTWNMTVTPLEGVYEGPTEISLPGRPYLALRVRPVL